MEDLNIKNKRQQYFLEYRRKNLEILRQKHNEKIFCEHCMVYISRSNRLKHEKTKKHTENIIL